MFLIIYLNSFFCLKLGSCLTSNLLLRNTVAKEFIPLHDGNTTKLVKSNITVPYKISIYSDYALEYLVFFYPEVPENHKVKVYAGDESNNNYCGEFTHQLTNDKKEFFLNCTSTIRTEHIVIKPESWAAFSEIEAYGEGTEKSQFYATHGCFKDMQVISMIKFESVDCCLQNCKLRELRYTALNQKKCGCSENIPSFEESINDCSNCPASSYPCGYSSNFQILEEINLCAMNVNANYCEDNKFCVNNHGRILCLKNEGSFVDDLECDRTTYYINEASTFTSKYNILFFLMVVLMFFICFI